MNALSHRWNGSSTTDTKKKEADVEAQLNEPLLCDDSEATTTTTTTRLPIPKSYWRFQMLIATEDVDGLPLSRTRREILVGLGIVLVVLALFALTGFATESGLAQPILLCFLLGVSFYGFHRHQQGRFERLGPAGFSESNVAWMTKWYGTDAAMTAHSRFMLARTHEILGQHDQAAAAMQELLAQNPRADTEMGGSVYYFHSGLLQYATHRYQDALTSFTRTARLRRNQNPYYPDQTLDRLDVNLGVCKLRGKPNSIRWHNVGLAMQYMGQCHERLGQYGEAIRTYQQSIQELETHGFQNQVVLARFSTRLAHAHEQVGNDAQAREALEEALRIHLLNEGEFPRSVAVAKVYVQLANLHERLLDWAKALEYTHEAINVHRRSGRTEEHAVVATLLQAVSDLEMKTPSSKAVQQV